MQVTTIVRRVNERDIVRRGDRRARIVGKTANGIDERALHETPDRVDRPTDVSAPNGMHHACGCGPDYYIG